MPLFNRTSSTRSQRRAAPHGGRAPVAGLDLVARPKLTAASEQQARAVANGRRRIGIASAVLLAAFTLLGGRLVELGLTGSGEGHAFAAVHTDTKKFRPEILDRNGEVLATEVYSPSLYATPRNVIEPEQTARALASVFPDLDVVQLSADLASKRGFVWIRRQVTPKEQAAVHNLGLPGIGVRDELKRIYPNGQIASHVLGAVNIDNQGVGGMERYIDAHGLTLEAERAPTDMEPVRLSLDLRVQFALRNELARGMAEFDAKAAVGVVLDAETGELIAMSALPGFDPNNMAAAADEARFRRATLGRYEMGSVFKVFTTAAALDSGKVRISDVFDTRKPIKYANFEINDFHGQKRDLTVPEVFMHSSNIGTAKMALEIGRDTHKDYLQRLGLLDRMPLELPEVGTPMLPSRWTDLSTITISYGHGMSVAPLQVAAAASAVVNGGLKVEPTLLKRSAPPKAERVLSHDTSRQMQALLRLVVEKGTGKNADVDAYPVIGKTGTAEKPVGGHYSRSALITSFLGAFPAYAPRYVTLIMFDEPKPTPDTHGYATAGWNAAPVTSRVVRRIAPMLGVRPVETAPTRPQWQAPQAPLKIAYQPQ